MALAPPLKLLRITVALTKYLNNTDYQLHYKILECSGGYVESVEFYDLASNAFKVRYTGSAKVCDKLPLQNP